MPEERYITLAEVTDLLEASSGSRELSPEQKISLDHAKRLSKLDAGKAEALRAELAGMGFISDALCVKIADLLPAHADDVRVLFTKERMVLEKKNIEQILTAVQKYL